MVHNELPRTDGYKSLTVGIALDRRSDTSVQLKAAVTVEILDYILQSRWSPEVSAASIHKMKLPY